MISVVTFWNKKLIPTYEVEIGSIKDSEFFRGITLKDETLVYSPLEGYIQYYYREGEKVAKNNIICTIGSRERQRIQEVSSLDTAQLEALQKELSQYNSMYQNASFDDVYHLKYQINNKLLEFNEVAVSTMSEIESFADELQLKAINSEESGLISYTIDGLEQLTLEDIHLDIFNKNLEKKQLLAQKNVAEGDPLYKIMNDKSWSIVFPETDKLLEYIEGRSRLSIKMLKDNVSLTGDIERISTKGEPYVKITFNNSLNRYINDRFLEFEIVYSEAEGIKIPNSAIVTKNFYQIPMAFTTRSGQERGLLRSVNVEGIETVQFVALGTNYFDGEYYYIREDKVNINDLIIMPDTEETYRISNTKSLQGIYDGTRGYAQFKLIHVIYAGDDYSIVEKEIPYGVRLYDQIIIEGSNVEENEMIY
jgi:hypothetical protein